MGEAVGSSTLAILMAGAESAERRGSGGIQEAHARASGERDAELGLAYLNAASFGTRLGSTYIPVHEPH